MIAAIRIRGSVGTTGKVEDTMNMIRLSNVNNCSLLEDKPEVKGMIEKCKDYITYGEIDKDTLVSLLKKRLRLVGNKRIDEKVLKEITGEDSFENFANSLIEGKTKLKNFEKLQPSFNLTPPSKGFKSIRNHYPKGDLGNRGKEINGLLKRMM